MALTYKPFEKLEKKMQIDPESESKEEIRSRNHANGVSQAPAKQSSVDEWLAMGAMLVEEMRAKRATLVAELAQIDSALRKLSPEAKAPRADTTSAETPPVRRKRKEGGNSQADLVAAVVPKLRAEAITSGKIGELSGVGALVAQKTLSMLFAKGRVHRARDINLLHGFLYWDAK